MTRRKLLNHLHVDARLPADALPAPVSAHGHGQVKVGRVAAEPVLEGKGAAPDDQAFFGHSKAGDVRLDAPSVSRF